MNTTRQRQAAGLSRWGRALAIPVCAAIALASYAGAASTTHVVEIEAMKFAPAKLEVKAGDTVTWRNKDPFPHTATAEQKGFDSGNLEADRSWSFKTRDKGVFPYVCSLHPGMKGVLVVR